MEWLRQSIEEVERRVGYENDVLLQRLFMANIN